MPRGRQVDRGAFISRTTCWTVRPDKTAASDMLASDLYFVVDVVELGCISAAAVPVFGFPLVPLFAGTYDCCSAGRGGAKTNGFIIAAL